MIRAILNEVLGPAGRAILDFYFHNQTIINIIFLVWAGFMTYASLQLNNIRHMTVRMAVEFMKTMPGASNEQVWQAFLPKWTNEVEKINPRLILNRYNLCVTKPTIDKLIVLLQLSPEWFESIRNGEVLKFRFAIPGKKDKLSSFLKKVK